MTPPPVFLDRRITDDFAGVSPTYGAGATTWTLPYSIATDGSEGTVAVVRDDTRAVLVTTRPTATTVRFTGVDLSAVAVWIGLLFGFVVQFSVIYSRDRQTGAPDIRGRTNLRYVKIHYEDATRFTVTVTSAGRAARDYEFTAADLTVPESGEFLVPIQSQNTQTTITVTADTPGAAGFSGYEWEGVQYTRVRRA